MGVFEELKHQVLNYDLLKESSWGLFFLLGVIIMLWVQQIRSKLNLKKELRQLKISLDKERETFSLIPVPYAIWDQPLGQIKISKRMALFLGLSQETCSTFDDVKSCFEGVSLKEFELACVSLRSHGEGFRRELSLAGRVVQVKGMRIIGAEGVFIADFVSIQELSELKNYSQEQPFCIEGGGFRSEKINVEDKNFKVFCDLIPIPLWIKNQNAKIIFSNSSSKNILDVVEKINKKEEDKSSSRSVGEVVDLGSDLGSVELTEISLALIKDGRLGFALPLPKVKIDKAENRRQRGMEASEFVLKNLKLPIAIFDKKCDLDFFNAAFSKLWNLDDEWLELKPSLLEIYEKLRKERRLPEVADFNSFKERELKRFNFLTEPLIDLMFLPDGRSLRRQITPYGSRGLAYSFEDMSEQFDLQRSVKELGAVQDETLNNLHEGVAVFGSDGRLKLFNPAFLKLWEIKEESLKEKPHLSKVLELTRKLIPASKTVLDWSDEAWAAYKSNLIARILSRTSIEGQLRLINAVVVNYENVPLPDGATLLSYMDVSDSDKIEQALRERIQASEDADRMKSEFIANVSREIRKPLKTIIGHAEMLEQGYFGKLNKRQEEYSQSIFLTSQGLVKVVEDILDLAEMDAGQAKIAMVPIDIHEILVSSLDLVKNRIQKKHLNIEFECPTDIGWMVGDKERLKQIFYKLLLNSVIYTPPRGKISLQAIWEKSIATITISDTGVGIPQDEKRYIFNAFVKGSSTLREKEFEQSLDSEQEYSVGLGLTIVKRFIEAQGGSIEVKSSSGRGTKVICRFPQAEGN